MFDFKFLIAYTLITALFIFCGGLLVTFFWNLVIPPLFLGPQFELVHGVAVVALLWIFGNVLRNE